MYMYYYVNICPLKISLYGNKRYIFFYSNLKYVHLYIKLNLENTSISHFLVLHQLLMNYRKRTDSIKQN